MEDLMTGLKAVIITGMLHDTSTHDTTWTNSYIAIYNIDFKYAAFGHIYPNKAKI